MSFVDRLVAQAMNRSNYDPDRTESMSTMSFRMIPGTIQNYRNLELWQLREEISDRMASVQHLREDVSPLIPYTVEDQMPLAEQIADQLNYVNVASIVLRQRFS